MGQRDHDKTVPQPPRPTAAPQPLDPPDQTHEGDKRTPQSSPGSMQQRGATEHEVAPIKPLTQAPTEPVDQEREVTEDDIDPRDELTPG